MTITHKRVVYSGQTINGNVYGCIVLPVGMGSESDKYEIAKSCFRLVGDNNTPYSYSCEYTSNDDVINCYDRNLNDSLSLIITIDKVIDATSPEPKQYPSDVVKLEYNTTLLLAHITNLKDFHTNNLDGIHNEDIKLLEKEVNTMARSVYLNSYLSFWRNGEHN